jgi:septum formation protein
MRLVLASASPRRADLLRAAGFQFDVHPVDVDESHRSGESPASYVLRLAREKSAAARGPVQDRIIIGADTAVVVAGEILGKPANREDAERMLRLLSGREHEVLTGISVRHAGREVGRVERTAVSFTALSSSDIDWYLESAEWRDKAGAYGIQGLASRFITRIDGSYSNVVGLPVALLPVLLSELARLASAP